MLRMCGPLRSAIISTIGDFPVKVPPANMTCGLHQVILLHCPSKLNMLAFVSPPVYQYHMKFIYESRIAATPEQVFAFHESPEALARLIPPWEHMAVAERTGSLVVGSRVVLRGRMLGLLPVRWVAVHTEYNPPHLFADRQEIGPFASWYHRHHILDDGQGGTVLRDEIDYRLPIHWLSYRVFGWWVRRKLMRMFVYRHTTTKQIVEQSC